MDKPEFQERADRMAKQFNIESGHFIDCLFMEIETVYHMGKIAQAQEEIESRKGSE